MADPEDAPFSEFTDRLRTADAARRRRFARWESQLLLFRRLTDEVLWEGMVVALANLWAERDELTSVLRSIGAVDHADRISIAVDRASFSGLLRGGRLDADAVNASPVLQLFEAADEAFDSDWERLWRLAEAYARKSGWSGETTL